MAIYHFDLKRIQRSKGQSAVAKAAYNSRSKLLDERTGKTYNYSRRKDLEFSEILLPESAPKWAASRQNLWSQAELAENRRNSQTGQQIIVALPQELNDVQNQELVRNFVVEELVNLGMAADLSIHNPHSESPNPHAHILLTARGFENDDFAKKKDRSWLNRDHLKKLRAKWAEAVNKSLSAAGFKQTVDHRSWKDKGIDRIPQIHLGPAAVAMARKGVETERLKLYNSINATNAKLGKLAEGKQKLALLPEPLNISPDSALEPEIDADIEAETTDKNAKLIEHFYGGDRHLIPGDIELYNRIMAKDTNEKRLSNFQLTTKAIRASVEAKQIRRLLINSTHTNTLNFEEAVESINNSYRLARSIELEKIAGFDPTHEFLEVFQRKNLKKLEISLAQVLVALSMNAWNRGQLNEILRKFDLEVTRVAYTKTFSLHQLENPAKEFVSAFEVGCRTKIVHDDLPAALKKEIFAALLEIDTDNWEFHIRKHYLYREQAKKFNALKLLKYEVLSKLRLAEPGGAKIHYPPSLVSIDALRTATEPPANQVGANFKQFEEIAAEQELVATYFVSTEPPAQKEKPKEQEKISVERRIAPAITVEAPSQIPSPETQDEKEQATKEKSRLDKVWEFLNRDVTDILPKRKTSTKKSPKPSRKQKPVLRQFQSDRQAGGLTFEQKFADRVARQKQDFEFLEGRFRSISLAFEDSVLTISSGKLSDRNEVYFQARLTDADGWQTLSDRMSRKQKEIMLEKIGEHLKRRDRSYRPQLKLRSSKPLFKAKPILGGAKNDPIEKHRQKIAAQQNQAIKPKPPEKVKISPPSPKVEDPAKKFEKLTERSEKAKNESKRQEKRQRKRHKDFEL